MSWDASDPAALAQSIVANDYTTFQIHHLPSYKYFFDKKVRPYGDDAASAFSLSTLGREGFFHAPYLVNLASAKKNIQAVSRICVNNELRDAKRMGMAGIVVHAGSGGKGATGVPFYEAYANVVDNLERVLLRADSNCPLLLIENTAGHGTVGENVEPLVELIRTVRKAVPSMASRLGIMLDTAHLWGAGVDLTDPALPGYYKEQYGDVIRGLHFNMPDPDVALASGRDRHACKITEGACPSGALHNWFDQFHNLPLIVERRSTESASYDIELLRQWSLDLGVPSPH